MRVLPTAPEPRELTTGRARLQATPNVGVEWYENLDREAKAAIRNQRLREQGAICAYTQLRLSADNFHIEHMFPQDHCTPAEKIAYDNLVLCYPSGQQNPGFGAVEKGNWPDRSQRALFVRPVDPSCATRFLYQNDGQMVAADPADGAAQETISRLKLNEPLDPENPQNHVLRKRRWEAIEAVLRGLRTVEQVRARLAQQDFNTQGQLPEFVSAKEQALKRLLKKLSNIQKYSRSG